MRLEGGRGYAGKGSAGGHVTDEATNHDLRENCVSTWADQERVPACRWVGRALQGMAMRLYDYQNVCHVLLCLGGAPASCLVFVKFGMPLVETVAADDNDKAGCPDSADFAYFPFASVRLGATGDGLASTDDRGQFEAKFVLEYYTAALSGFHSATPQSSSWHHFQSRPSAVGCDGKGSDRFKGRG